MSNGLMVQVLLLLLTPLVDQPLTLKVTVDVVNGDIPADLRNAIKQDLYVNTGEGAFSAEWQAVTSNWEEGLTANPGDYMIHNGDSTRK